jgi:hypothetical protein
VQFLNPNIINIYDKEISNIFGTDILFEVITKAFPIENLF